jgi:hypothetical protein
LSAISKLEGITNALAKIPSEAWNETHRKYPELLRAHYRLLGEVLENMPTTNYRGELVEQLAAFDRLIAGAKPDEVDSLRRSRASTEWLIDKFDIEAGAKKAGKP